MLEARHKPITLDFIVMVTGMLAAAPLTTLNCPKLVVLVFEG